MTATPLEHPDPVSGLLERAVELRDLAAQAERELFITVADYAQAHTTGALLPDLYGPLRTVHEHPGDSAASAAWLERWGADGADTMLDLGGPGCPEVSDFAVTELWRVLSGEAPGRASADEVTVFDSVGFALEDYSALHFLFDAARELGIGDTIQLVPRLADPKDLFATIARADTASAHAAALPPRRPVLA